MHARGLQQFSQRPTPYPSQMAQLLAMSLPHWFIHPGQQFHPVRRDPGHHHAPIPGLPAARNQLALLQPVKHARDVRIPSDHAVANFSTRESVRCAAQDAKNVVLRRREFLRLQQLRQTTGKHVCRAGQLKKCQFLRAVRPTLLTLGMGVCFHLIRILSVTTTIVKTDNFTPSTVILAKPESPYLSYFADQHTTEIPAGDACDTRISQSTSPPRCQPTHRWGNAAGP